MEVGRERPFSELGNGAGHLDAGWAAADHNESHQSPSFVNISLVFGAFEGKQDAATQIGRVVDGLQPGCKRCPIVVAEIRMPRTCSEHQVVIPNAPPIGDHLFTGDIDPRHVREHDLDVALSTKDAANWRGDIGRREPCGCDLVEQRLKQMVVVAIDQRDVKRSVCQALGSREPAKASADNHYAGSGPC